MYGSWWLQRCSPFGISVPSQPCVVPACNLLRVCAVGKILEVTNLRKAYPLGDTSIHVLEGAHFSLDEGEMASIVGASGAGKSTFLHLLGTLDTPDEGTLLY